MKTPQAHKHASPSVVPVVASIILLAITVLLALELAAGFIYLSLNHWSSGAAPVNGSVPSLPVASNVTFAFTGFLSMGLARAVLMVITFVVSAFLLFTTKDVFFSKVAGNVAAILLLVLSLLTLFSGAIRVVFDDNISAVDYFAHLILGAVFAVFAVILVQILSQTRWLIWFAVPFLALMIVQMVLLIFAARRLEIDVRFIASLFYLLVMGLFAGAIAYYYKMCIHLQDK